jgi:hypothetical protein
MKQLLTAALVFASLLSAQAAKAEDASQTVTTAPQKTLAPAPEPIVISWDRVGGKEKWWV